MFSSEVDERSEVDAAYESAHTHMPINIHIHTCIHAYNAWPHNTQMHKHARMSMCMYTRTCIHIHTCMHTQFLP